MIRVPEGIIRKDATHFRFVDGDKTFSFSSIGGPRFEEPRMIQFKAVRETRCGFWISELDYGYSIDGTKWVSKTTRKRFAYPTIKEAKESYIIRKWKQIGHAKASIEKARAMLIFMNENPDEEVYSDQD